MDKLTPISWSGSVKRLRKLGFEGPYQGGKHPYMVKENLVRTIPNPQRREISVDLLSRILKRANIDRGEWLKETKI